MYSYVIIKNNADRSYESFPRVPLMVTSSITSTRSQPGYQYRYTALILFRLPQIQVSFVFTRVGVCARVGVYVFHAVLFFISLNVLSVLEF